MKRSFIFFGVAVFVAANVAAGLLYRAHLEAQAAETERAVRESPQARLKSRRAVLEQWQRDVNDYERRAGVTLAYVVQFFDAAAVGWEEIALESSGEAGAARLDVIAVRGLAGTSEQLSRVDKRLAPRCRSYRRSPTREGPYLLSCQVRPEAFALRN